MVAELDVAAGELKRVIGVSQHALLLKRSAFIEVDGCLIDRLIDGQLVNVVIGRGHTIPLYKKRQGQ